VKIKYDNVDCDTEKSKKVTQNFLVTAGSSKEAYDRIKESLSTLLVDFEIPSIIVSPIVEIFPYQEQLDKEIERRTVNPNQIDLVEQSEELENESKSN